MDAIELAKGIALRQAEQFGPYQRRTTYAFSDWLDAHCDELLADATLLLKLRETPAPKGPPPHSWTPNETKDKCLICGDGVWGRHRFQVQPETPAPPQEHLSGVNDDYYMPGHKHETKETPMTDPIIDVQTTLDDWLNSNPEAQLYVRKIYYLPDGSEIPREVTHMNRLTSIAYPNLDLRLGVVATARTAALANVILSLIERTAPDPKA